MSSPAFVIRRLTEVDAAAFRTLRLDALRTAPEAFGSSWEAEKDRPEAEFAATLASSYVAGAWRDGVLVGMAGFYAEERTKDAHRGKLWGVFIRPEQRGLGVARALIEDVLAFARPRVLQIHLAVVTDNASAVALYTRLGFSIYGTEPRSLLVDGRYLDEYLMVLRFDA